MKTLSERIFVALDVDENRFEPLVKSLPSATHFKIGLPLFLRIGPRGIETLKRMGKKVFLDFKLFDIPNTMAEAAGSLAALGADFFTVHLSAGPDHIKRVVEKIKETRPECRILGVSVLTSFNSSNLERIGITTSVADQVLKLAQIGTEAGVDGIVSSPLELKPLRQRFGDSLLYVTPGIRSASAPPDDQKRTLSFREALENGASYAVIGRPIVQAEDPERAFLSIVAEAGSGE